MTTIRKITALIGALLAVEMTLASSITVVGSLDQTDPFLTKLVAHGDLSAGSTIGLEPLDITVLVPGSLTTENALFAGIWWGDPLVGFGLGGFSPLVFGGETAFIYDVQLYMTGSSTPVAATGPQTINFLTDPSYGTDNLAEGGWAFGFGGYSFDGLHVILTSPTEREVTSFDFSLGIQAEQNSVPDSGSMLAFLSMAFASLCVFARRFRC